ncbi:MAG: hypothetical protein QOF04_3649, partial [Solirubrobacteraceae bacterium]|nr:hypothetical protein [Solirubrobacteraceae bacterium]
PSLVATRQDIDEMIDITISSITAACEGLGA